jgi:hypothetical protein
MANMVLNWRNWLDAEYATSAVSVAALSAQAAWPVVNLRKAINGQFSNPTRMKATGARYGGYSVDLGTARPVRTASLHRMIESSPRARIRVQASKKPLLGNPALRLDFLAGYTDGRTYPNDLDPRLAFSRASQGTLWRDGELFGFSLSTTDAMVAATGTQSFTITTGRKWQATDTVLITPQDGTADISMTGTVASYGGAVLTITVTAVGSDTSTTKTDWLIAYTGPRLDSEPLTKRRKGLLFEAAAATNLLTGSQAFETDWTETNATATDDAIVAPDGTTTAATLAEDGTTADVHMLSRSASFTSGSTYTFSVFVHPAGRTRLRLELAPDGSPAAFDADVYADFDFNAGSVTPGAEASDTFIERLPGGWYRCVVSGPAVQTADGLINIYLMDGSSTSYDGDGTSGVYLWGAQLEVSSFPTSYIWTGATTQARAADTATMTGTDFSDWFPYGGIFTMLTRFRQPFNLAAQGNIVTVYNTSTSDALAINTTQGNPGTVRSTTLPGPNVITGGNLRFNGLISIAAAVQANAMATSVDGAAAVTDISAPSPVLDALKLGSSKAGTSTWLGHIAEIAIWDSALSASGLQAVTDPGATLDVDFTACSVDLPANFSFTGSGATYEDANGDTAGQAAVVIAARAAALGAQTFPVGAGQDWKAGQRVGIAAAGPLTMIGDVTAYSGSILTVNVTETGADRTTTATDWTVTIVGPRFEYDDGTALGLALASTDDCMITDEAGPPLWFPGSFSAIWQTTGTTGNTIVVEAVAPANLAGTNTLLSIDDDQAGDDRIELINSAGTLQLLVIDGGVTQATLSLGSLTASTKFRAAVRIQTDSVAGSLNGAAAVTDTSATYPTLSTMRIGQDISGGDIWNGHVGRLIVKPSAHVDADLVLMSTAATDLSDYTIPGTIADAYAGDVDTGWILNRREYGDGDLPQGADEFTRHVFATDQEYRYWRVDMIDPEAPDSDPPTVDNGLAMEIGYLGLWQGHQFNLNPAYGAVQGWRSATQEQRSVGGARFTDRRTATRTWGLSFPTHEQPDTDALDDITAFLDRDRPTLLVFDPADDSGFYRTDALGTLTSLGDREWATFRRFSGGLGIETIVA